MGEETFLPFLLRDHTLSKGLGEKKTKPMETAECEMEKSNKTKQKTGLEGMDYIN